MMEDPYHRAFVVQAFELFGSTNRSVIAIAAHFPHHPVHHKDSRDGHIRSDQAMTLKAALAAVAQKTRITNVALVADTNEHNWTSSETIAQYLGFPAGDVRGTSLEETCCYTHFNNTFDRAITNFGQHMETTVLIDQLPNWAKQELNGHSAAFHKPILGSLVLDGSTSMIRRAAVSQHQQTSIESHIDVDVRLPSL